MQNKSIDHVKETLFSSIGSLLTRRKEFLLNPDSNFTRVKKISFLQTVLFTMTVGSDNLPTELLDHFGEDGMPLPSALIQRRNVIKLAAFETLFSEFTRKIPVSETVKGYQIAACDGCRVNLPYNPSDTNTFIKSIEGRKGINQIHMNALFDPLNDIFLDVILQGIHDMDEKSAFTTFLDKYAGTPEKRIYVCDRGYASYNIFAHAIHNSQLFLIRVPESFAKTISSDKHWLDDDDTVDKKIIVHIGRRKTKALCQLKNFHCIQKKGHYDFLEPGSDQNDQLMLRVVKFPISEDKYEYIVTNLPMDSFTADVIKELYNYRWGEEVAFRHLKYAGNMVHLHSRKNDFLQQEIYGKLTLYNYASWITACVGKEQKKTEKYLYVLNHTQAQKICIRYLRGTVKKLCQLICKFVVPVRLDRKFERCIRRQSADTLNYR